MKKLLPLLALLAALSLPVPGRAEASPKVWVGSWSAAQQIPEPQNALAPGDMADATIRQIVHLSIGGNELRVHLSNAFGTEPLRFTSVHIARPLSASSSAINPVSDRALTFSGSSEVTVPAGAEYLSDPINYPVAALSNLAITFHLDDAPARETGHPGSRATSYYVHGDQVSSSALPGAKTVDHWYQIADIDVLASEGAASIVALGDSITDGHASTTNGNDRWTDVLAERLQASAATPDIGVLNEGIGGNHLLTDGLGPNALARFDRDVLAQAGVRWLIVFEGVNDLGGLTRQGDMPPEAHTRLVHQVEASYEQIITRAHTHGIRVIGATITPYRGSDYYHPDARDEADRQAVNAWIRAPGHFDTVLDFDKAMRDPQRPDHLRPAYDCGDHLHPSPAGYRAMGQAVPLSLFAR
ncbi:MAG: SGNH/GDSL hydrolase family protein [Acidobacteriaceae bacterium]